MTASPGVALLLANLLEANPRDETKIGAAALMYVIVPLGLVDCVVSLRKNRSRLFLDVLLFTAEKLRI